MFFAPDFDNPVSSDWAAPTLAPASADTIRSAITVRRFDDTMEEGVGFALVVPSGAANVTIELSARPQSAPSLGPRIVGNRLYYRQIPNGTGPSTGWATRQLNNMTMATGATSYQYKPAQQIPLNGQNGFSPGIVAGLVYEFEFTRTTPTPGGTNLSGDFDLLHFLMTFT